MNPLGEVPEWPIGAVSKTVVALVVTVGSNPTLSAEEEPQGSSLLLNLTDSTCTSFRQHSSRYGSSLPQISAQGADLRFAEAEHHLEPGAELVKAVKGAGDKRGFARHTAVP